MTATFEESRESCEADREGDPPEPFRANSYADLLHFPPIPISAKAVSPGSRGVAAPLIDAIVVPTVRSAQQLNLAAEIAARLDCKLITLYNTFPDGLSSVLGKLIRRGAAAPLALPPPGSPIKHDLLDLAAELPQSRVSACALDISRKRNLGLLIGRAHGWTRMLFLDDDILKLTAAGLSRAAALLGRFPVVGLQVNRYPDASVVGHARRLAGRRQKPFISGGSLLVDPQRVNGFFPPIYHEDWLCIIDHLRRGEVAVGGSVGQLPYRPFTTPERAELEEFGDILVPSLLWLIKSGTGAARAAAADDCWKPAADPLFWKQVLQQRAALLENIAARLTRMSMPDPSPSKAAGTARPSKTAEAARQGLRSVEAAQRRCKELTPEEFVAFTGAWADRLAVWRDGLSRLPRVDSVEKALAELGLADVVRHYEPPAQETALPSAHAAAPSAQAAPPSAQARARGTRWSRGLAGRWGHRTAADDRGTLGRRGARSKAAP